MRARSVLTPRRFPDRPIAAAETVRPSVRPPVDRSVGRAEAPAIDSIGGGSRGRRLTDASSLASVKRLLRIAFPTHDELI